MDKTRILANIFSKIRQKGDDIMFGFALDIINAFDIKGTTLPDCGRGIAWNYAEFCLRITSMRLNFKPDLKFAFLRPNCGHLRPGITRNHTNNTFCVNRCQVVTLRPVKSQNLAIICG